MKAKYIYIKAFSLFSGFLTLFSKKLALNYCVEKNAGDMFNVDYISEKYNKKIKKYTFGPKDHYLFCGSILGRSNKYSTIIGAGFISRQQAESPLVFKKIIGVRGKLTAQHLLNKNSKLNFSFLGDPGLLAREIIEPRSNSQTNKKEFIIGVIPHFIDYDNVKKLVRNDSDIRLIDIKNDFKKVCKSILECDVILSSSLHGLIFSDAMNVPNVWITFGNNIIGGRFKFMDYYSVMDNPKNDAIECKEIKDLKKIVKLATVSENSNYNKMKLAIDKNMGM